MFWSPLSNLFFGIHDISHNDISSNDILRAGFDAVKPEIVAGGKVDFVNGWNTEFLPVQKSRGPPILRMKRILDTAKSIQLTNADPLPDNDEVDDDIFPQANPHLVGYPWRYLCPSTIARSLLHWKLDRFIRCMVRVISTIQVDFLHETDFHLRKELCEWSSSILVIRMSHLLLVLIMIHILLIHISTIFIFLMFILIGDQPSE